MSGPWGSVLKHQIRNRLIPEAPLLWVNILLSPFSSEEPTADRFCHPAFRVLGSFLFLGSDAAPLFQGMTFPCVKSVSLTGLLA